MIHDSIILFPSHICRLETRSSGVRLSVNMTPPSALFYTAPGLFKFFLFEVSKCRDVRKSSSSSPLVYSANCGPGWLVPASR